MKQGFAGAARLIELIFCTRIIFKIVSGFKVIFWEPDLNIII
jgi:hypothetical protein